MKSGELIKEFRKRGHPIHGNEVRGAWNRLWTARKNGVLTHDPKLGYWISGEALSEEAKERAAQAARAHPRRAGPSLRALSKGKKKGPPPALTAKDVQRAERMLLAGKTRSEVAATLGGISQNTLAKYIPGGISGLKARYPNVIIPKRPFVPRPRRPGLKGLGRPLKLTPDQAREIGVMRANGKTINEIAVVMAVRSATIYKYLKRLKSAANRAEQDEALPGHLEFSSHPQSSNSE
jgi:DNA invertase Pin-like site-specific DNA recombinase